MAGPDGSGGEPWSIEGRIARFLDEVSQRLWQALPTLLGLGLVFLLTTGFYRVSATQIGLVRTLGKITGQSLPGLHYYLPLVQEVERIDVGTTRQVRVGSVDRKRGDEEPLYRTQTGELVSVTATVLYRIVDVEKYSTRLANQDRGARIVVETALTEVVHGAPGAELFGAGRARFERALQTSAQSRFDVFQSGIVVTEAHLAVARPEAVNRAGEDATRARDAALELLRRAESDRLTELSDAKAEALRIRAEGAAYAQPRVVRARSDAERFLTVQAEYARARDVTKQRLRLETLGRVLSKVRKKTIVDTGASAPSEATSPKLENLP